MSSDQNLLIIKCPFCGHEHTDDFEVLSGGRPETLRCEGPGCGKQFGFLIRECLECGEESLFTWKTIPAGGTLALLSCHHCGAPFDEAAGEDQGTDPTQRI